jgi:hypothetical protein
MMRRAPGTIAAALFLIGCQGGMSGTWSDTMGAMSYAFARNGSVELTVMGLETELTYQRDGRVITVISPQGKQVLTLTADGSLIGPQGMKLLRKP